MQKQKFSWKHRASSFTYAFSGFAFFFAGEHNAWLHAVATGGVLALSFVLHISRMEWIAVVFAIAMVWITEMFNTAIEKIMDHLSPAFHPQVKFIKDISAAAVLTAAVSAFVIGLIIFIPKLL